MPNRFARSVIKRFENGGALNVTQYSLPHVETPPSVCAQISSWNKGSSGS